MTHRRLTFLLVAASSTVSLGLGILLWILVQRLVSSLRADGLEVCVGEYVFCAQGMPWWVHTLGVMAVLGALVLSWTVVVRLVQAPLRSMARTVDLIGMQNLGQRIGRPGDDALARLAASVDALADRVAAGFEGQRRFAANASHELRTPLAVQRTLVELAVMRAPEDGELRRLADQILLTGERNDRIVEGMLVLAESDRGLADVTALRLDELVGTVLDAHTDLAGSRGIRIDRHLDAVTLTGDRVLLERLVSNLVGNGLLHNGPEFAETPTLTVRVGPGSPTLEVANTGPVVAAESVTTLFEPFRRAHVDRTRPTRGAGLGLSIVRSVAAAHGGRVDARPTTGGGLTVTVDLTGCVLPRSQS